MNVRRQSTGEMFTLDDRLRIGGGGEGTIFRLSHREDLAVKIYQADNLSAEGVSKLKAMLAHAPHDPMRATHASIAWPVDLVLSADGHPAVIGFLMPRIDDARPISDVYSSEVRNTVFPLFSYASLCRTATNLASAVWAIHESGYVIGDVNESNILVTKGAMLTLVDTDSFQVTDPKDKRVYRCTVGTQLFTPREVQGQNLKTFDRAPAQDLFGIAVLFFQLLMEGTFPFAGVFPNDGDAPDLTECLKQGLLPYGARPQMKPPPGAPPFATLHPALQDLFLRCFAEGHADPERRPGAKTWYRTLKESEKDLISCHANRRHKYFRHYPHCPWCERANLFRSAKSLNWDPFPRPVSAGKSQSGVGPRSLDPASQSVSSRAARQRVSTPTVTPTAAAAVPSFFTASARSVTPGQPVTFEWLVPNARTVQLTDQSGKSLFTGSSLRGVATVYPAGSSTYHLNASGPGVSLPRSISVTVTQAQLPETLKAVSVALRELFALHPVRVRLRPIIALKAAAVQIRSPLKLKVYLRLNSYKGLNKATVSLKDYLPLVQPPAHYRGQVRNRGSLF